MDGFNVTIVGPYVFTEAQKQQLAREMKRRLCEPPYRLAQDNGGDAVTLTLDRVVFESVNLDLVVL